MHLQRPIPFCYDEQERMLREEKKLLQRKVEA